MTAIAGLDRVRKTPESPRNHRHAPEAADPPSTEPSASSASQAVVSSVTHRERDDHYRGVLAILNDQWRLIVCRDAIQWILQKRDGPHRWEGRYHCRTKSGLLSCIGEYCGPVAQTADDVLAARPDRTKQERVRE